MTPTTGPAGPVLIDLDEATWKEHLDRTEVWLDHLAIAQAAFRTMAFDVAGRYKEPRVHAHLTRVAEAALRHEGRVDEMYRVVGREPGRVGKAAGAVAAKGVESFASVAGWTFGVAGAYSNLAQLSLISFASIAAFSTAEQLGYSLAIPALSSIAFDVTAEKSRHHRLLQELVLELAAPAILYEVTDL